MKKASVFLSGIFLIFSFLGMANATLWDRGGGLIYDDVLNITWLQDANYAATELTSTRINQIIESVGSVAGHTLTPSDFHSSGLGMMTWWGAMAWVKDLTYGGYTDWRLPKTVDGPYVWGYDGTTTAGYNITTSEMGYMFYVNLENLAYSFTDGTSPQPGYGLTNTSFESGGPDGSTVSFQNLNPTSYWSDTEFSPDPLYAWYVHYNLGYQRYFDKNGYHYVWPVRDGDVAPIPEPGTMLLLGSGLVGLAGLRRRFRSK